MTAFENVFFAVVMIGLIVMFSLGFIFFAGWLVIMAIDFLKNHFRKRRGTDND